MPLRQESLTVLGIRLFFICIFTFLSSIFCTLVVSAQDCLSHRCAEFMRCYTGGPGGVPVSIDFEGACPSIPLVGSHCPSFPSMRVIALELALNLDCVLLAGRRFFLFPLSTETSRLILRPASCLEHSFTVQSLPWSFEYSLLPVVTTRAMSTAKRGQRIAFL